MEYNLGFGKPPAVNSFIEYKPDQLIMISNGEYSSYEVFGLFIVRRPLTAKVLDDYLKQLTIESKIGDHKSHFYPVDFIDYLVSLEYIRRIDIPELYLGDFGQVVFIQKRVS